MFILNCNIKQFLLFKVICVKFWSELPLVPKVILYGFRVLLRYPDKFLTESLSAHGSELVAMRIARDLVVATRIKLKCFGYH